MAGSTWTAGIGRARLRASRILRIEQAGPALLPSLALLLVYAVLALLDLPQQMPVWLQVPVLLLVLGAAAWLAWQRLRRIASPAPDAVDRRIEQRSGLRHRPLQALADRPAGDPGPMAGSVWDAHLERVGSAIGELHTGWPRLGLLRHDPHRLSLPLAAALLAALLVAGGQIPDRLAAGFLPGLFEPPGPAPRLQAWITPPDYTHAAPVFLTQAKADITVPAGSVLQISLTGVLGHPRLDQQPLDAAPRSAIRLDRLAAGSWALHQALQAPMRLDLRANGRALADWTLRVAPPPQILVAWNGTPGPASEPWLTRLPWHVAHPYGVTSLAAEIRIADPKDAATTPLRVPITLPPDARDASGTALPDLAADPRAGEAVIARLLATDATGHTAVSGDARLRLPLRPFRNPLARAVLEARKRLALGRESRAATASDLQALGDAPGAFATDSGLFLNLSGAASLLRDDDVQDDAAIREATGRLWDLALALEDGLHNDRAGARAAADVRAARDALGQQLERMRQLGDKGQTAQEQSELERRMQTLMAAIARRLQALAEQAKREHTMLPPMPDARALTGGDLSRMMQQMRDAASQGHTQEAMQQLQRMQSMLDRMRSATPQDLQSLREQSQAQAQVREQMEGLHDLERRQSAMLDQSQARQAARQREAQARNGADQRGQMDEATAELLSRLGVSPPQEQGFPPPNPTGRPDDAPDPQAEARRQKADEAAERKRAEQRAGDTRTQHALSRALEELGQEFKGLSGKQPGGFNEAGQAMKSAREALAAGQDQAAQQAQQQALAALQKGGQQMQQALASSQGGSPMLLPGMPGNSPSDDPGDAPGQEAQGDGQDPRPGQRDPLGRPIGTGPHADDGDTHVPDTAERLRSREIEQELRRRDTDRTRPPAELDYLDRLLKSF
nr:DUF4175 family protein [uncultured Lichenicoccus sp.]